MSVLGSRSSTLPWVLAAVLIVFLTTTALAAPCPKCGSSVASDDANCGVCGAPLPESRGSLSVASEPSGSVVYHLGTRIGVTPIKREGLKPGNYNLLIRKEGYLPERVRLTVRAGRLTDSSIRLKKTPEEQPTPAPPPSEGEGISPPPDPAGRTVEGLPLDGPPRAEAPSLETRGSRILPSRTSTLEDFFSTATGSSLGASLQKEGPRGGGLSLDPEIVSGSGAGTVTAEETAAPGKGVGRLKVTLVYRGRGLKDPEIEITFDGKVLGQPEIKRSPVGLEISLQATVATGVHAVMVAIRGDSPGGSGVRVKSFSAGISPGEDTELYHEWSGGLDSFDKEQDCCRRAHRRP